MGSASRSHGTGERGCTGNSTDHRLATVILGAMHRGYNIQSCLWYVVKILHDKKTFKWTENSFTNWSRQGSSEIFTSVVSEGLVRKDTEEAEVI